MLNWATGERVRDNKLLLESSPLHRVKLPSEKNPRRKVATYERFEKTRAAMRRLCAESTEGWDRVRWIMLELALVLAEATGRRLSSIRQLKWEDLDLGLQPRIRWRADADKKGREGVVPVVRHHSLNGR